MKVFTLVLLVVIFAAVVYSYPADFAEDEVHSLERRGNGNGKNKNADKHADKAKQKADRAKQKADRAKEKAEKEADKAKKKAERKAEKEARKLERWNRVKAKLDDKSKDWKMDRDDPKKHYSKKMKEKLEKGEKLSRNEIDTFENEFGTYKSQKDLSVVELLIANNQAHDVQGVEEVDIKKMQLPKHLKKTKRDTRFDAAYLWLDRIVPYEFDALLLDSQDIIVSAMNEIQSKSCIRFVPRTNQKHWVKFVKKSGCWSNVGRTFWTEGFQEISLGNGCVYKGTIMHELLHALGFYHEQSRYDRDKNVEIFWENINKDAVTNFNKEGQMTSSTLGAPYDVHSIMHYGKYAFALDGKKPSMLALSDQSISLGQRTELSSNDIFQLKKLYSCHDSGTGWSTWSEYGPCDLTSVTNCNKKRQRFCMDPNDKTSCPGPTSTALLYWGVDEQMASCSCSEQRDGHWGRWGSWGSCSVSCDQGQKSRTRVCDDPAPKNSGNKCPGENAQNAPCVMKSCNAGPYDSDFETTPDVWSSDPSGNFQWTRKSDGTPSSSTGPSGDHTSGTGHYMYIETSSPTATGWKARLMSPTMSGGVRCMTFWYHMYGASTGSLNVYANDKVVFNKNGDQLNQWHLAKFDISGDSSYQVVIEGVRGTSFQGDIGIDDITIKDHSCFAPIPTPAPTVPEFVPVGCYHDKDYIDGKRPFTEYKVLSHLITKWSADYSIAKETYYNDIIIECATFARSKNYKYFAIQYHYECWTGPNEEINYSRDGESTGCYPTANMNLGPSIIGQESSNMVYRWEDL